VSRLAMLVAAVLLVAIGSVEAATSAAQLAAVAGPLRLGGPGVLLSVAGFVASAAVYLALGVVSRDERAAARSGILTGLVAGAIGGALRAWIIREETERLVSRYSVESTFFVGVGLAVFVVLSCAASAVGGGALAWTGRRLSRAARSRPPA